MTVSWRLVILLCSFGFLKEFRPSESFVTDYLVGPHKNFTKEQVSQDIYPVGTYSNLSVLILVFLLTDWARYKPVIILEGLAGVATYCLIIWGQDIPTIQVAEFFYGLFMATEVAYLTYIYAMSDKKHFQKVSGCVRSGILSGRFVSGLTSQLLVSLNILNFHQLNFLTLAGVSLSVVVASALPSVEKSLYFHRRTTPQLESNVEDKKSSVSLENEDQESHNCSSPEFEDVNLEAQDFHSPHITNNHSSHVLSSQSSDIINNLSFQDSARTGISDAFRAMSIDFQSAYKDAHVFKWSLWWSLATCGYLQVTSYIQVLWHVTAEENQLSEYNGVVDAVYTLIGAISTWFIGRQKINLKNHSCVILTICSLLQGALLLVSAATANLWLQYFLYIMFKVLYHSTMVLASSEVATSLSSESHALIFGFNMFIALCFQSIFTLVVAAKGGLKLEIRSQFLVYGSYFITLGVGFLMSICVAAVNKYVKHVSQHNKNFQSPE